MPNNTSESAFGFIKELGGISLKTTNRIKIQTHGCVPSFRRLPNDNIDKFHRELERIVQKRPLRQQGESDLKLPEIPEPQRNPGNMHEATRCHY